MKIVLLLTISNLVIPLATQEVRRYFMNIDCKSLTHEQCAAKADETYQEYCMTNNDDCTNYNIFDYDGFSTKGIDYSTITECINNDGVIMKCECHEGFLDSSETQRGIKCRTESGTDDELTTLKPIIPTTEPITSDISHLTSEQTLISTSETTESEIDITEKLTTTETTSIMRNVSTSSEQTTISTSETTEEESEIEDKLTTETMTTIREVSSVTSEQTSISLSESTKAETKTTAELTATETMSTMSDISSFTSEQTTLSQTLTTKTATTTDDETESLTTTTPSGAVTTTSDVSTGTPEIETTAMLTTADTTSSTPEQTTAPLSETTETESEILIREGWREAANGVFYKLFVDDANFAEARSRCAEQEAILASKILRDPTSYSEVIAHLRTNSASPWIGLNDITTEGTWVWEDGVYATGDELQWQEYEPNDSNGEDCVELYFGGLNDLGCDY